jgi:hypothetical protein
MIYLKITKHYSIYTKAYILVGDVLCLIDVSTDNTITISIKNFNKAVYSFSPQQSPITIGRQSCTLNFDSTSISKQHCTIEYNNVNKQWEVSDGYSDRQSTNGTWLWITSKVELADINYISLFQKIIKLTLY